MRTAVIGPGTMGLMAARRIVAAGISRAGDVRLSRVRPERATAMAEGLPGALLFEDNAEAVAGADLVIVSVKPRQFADAGGALQGKIPDHALVVSVMTGVDLASLSGLMGSANIVRASTNIGIDAGCATTYWIGLPGIDAAARDLAIRLFAAWGDAIECSGEALLDIAMVGVGSGPALVIEFIQALTQAMVTQGMARDIAERGILSLIRGTVELAGTGRRSLADFQQSVVTPGGITAEALLALDEGRFRATIINAFRRAHEKRHDWRPRGRAESVTTTETTERTVHMATNDTCCTIVPYFSVNDGQLDAFRNLAERFVARSAGEPQCLYYGFSFNGSDAHCREGYQNASAALAHLSNVGDLLEESRQYAQIVRLEIHGPEEELAKLRGPLADLNARFFALEYGFRR